MLGYPFEEPVAIICDEEGKLKGSALNRALRDEEGRIYDVIAGTFLVTGIDEANFTSLRPEHIEKFSNLYETPELFVRMNGKLMVFPMEEQRAKAEKPSVMGKLRDAKPEEPAKAPCRQKRTER